MKFMKIWLCLATALLSVFVACKKDDPITPIGSTNWPGETVKTSFMGIILNEAGQPVADATVQLAANSVMSDKNGVFILKNQSVNSARTIISASKSGYWDAQRTLFVQKNSENRIVFRLFEKKKTGSFSATTGGKITVPGGAELDFPAEAVSKNGQLYSGLVQVWAHAIDPNSANIDETMPGSRRGLLASGEEAILTTFGLLGVELTDDLGQKLEIANGKKVGISVEIAPGLLANAPNSLPLWHFSEKEGLWEEAGEAQKIGSKYIGEVPHFSWWDFGYQGPAVMITGKIVDENGNPVVAQILACLSQGCSITGSNWDGTFTGVVVKDQSLNMSVVSYFFGGNSNASCNNILKEWTIGPLSSDTDLGTIVVDLDNPLTNFRQKWTVSGTVSDCNNQSTANGYVLIGENAFGISIDAGFFPIDAQGHFSGSNTYCTGNAPTSLYVTAFDFSNDKQSAKQTLPFAQNVDFGSITTCDDLDEYVRSSFDGGPMETTIPSPDSGFVKSEIVVRGGYVYFGFLNPLQATNDIPLVEFVRLAENIWADTTASGYTLQTDLTSYPAVIGQYLIGTYAGNFKDQFGVAHTVNGSYRVKRKW